MQKLTTRTVVKPWGRVDLPPTFDNPQREQVGEIWYQGHGDQILPLLVKYIFTSERLSIQVHPNDVQGRAAGLAGGKEEAWYIVDCEPDARLGIGLTRSLSADAFHAAALDGSLEHLIDWKPVKPGDCFFIPAGTVHAIGAGIVLAEIQQNVDVTYRLYDYGRPRELHLAEGMAVSHFQPYSRERVAAVPQCDRRLVDIGDAPFWLDILYRGRGEQIVLPPEDRLWFLPLKGAGQVNGKSWTRGECWLLDQADTVVAQEDATILLAAAR